MSRELEISTESSSIEAGSWLLVFMTGLVSLYWGVWILRGDSGENINVILSDLSYHLVFIGVLHGVFFIWFADFSAYGGRIFCLMSGLNLRRSQYGIGHADFVKMIFAQAACAEARDKISQIHCEVIFHYLLLRLVFAMVAWCIFGLL